MKITTEEAHTVIVMTLMRDVRYLLRWLTIGLFCMALVNLIHLIHSIADRQWVFAAFDALLMLLFAALTYGANRRQERYPAETTGGAR